MAHEAPAFPIIEQGPVIDAVRAQLRANAVRLGRPALPEVDWQIDTDGRHSLALPAGGALVRLRSASGYHPPDARRLGLAVASVALDRQPVPLNDPRLAGGFHALEPGLRWTDGDALLLLGAPGAGRVLSVHVVAVAVRR